MTSTRLTSGEAALALQVGQQRFNADWKSPEHRFRRLLAEFIGTAGLTFVLSAGAAILTLYGGIKMEPLIGAFVLSAISALWLVVAIYFLGDISSHFNPAMTFAFTLRGDMGWVSNFFFFRSAGLARSEKLVVRDYVPAGKRPKTPEELLNRLSALSPIDLVDPASVSRALHVGCRRALGRCGRPQGLSTAGQGSATATQRHRSTRRRHFGTLQKLLSAGIDDLQAVDGVGELRAWSVREGLSRLAESSILERFV